MARQNIFGQSYQLRWQQQEIELVKENVSVWTKGSAYPPSGSDILRVPFQLQLPLNIQPSFEMSSFYKEGFIGYFVEVIGSRRGVLVPNRRIVRPFAVVTSDPEGVSLRESLLAGWTGAVGTSVSPTP